MGRTRDSAAAGQLRNRTVVPFCDDPRLELPDNVEPFLTDLRRRLEAAFRPDTANQQFGPEKPPSAGHCAAVATILQQLAGGHLVSARVQGQSHWFNRLVVGKTVLDIDLTGDQFGLRPIRLGHPDSLFPETRMRTPTDLRPETLERAINLSKRAGFEEVARSLRRRLQASLESCR